ncbi:MAG TPA: CDP-alcohol phosphatidyltransferase family protein [Baekduia sp.]|nr:CDP-alcohol phosphatidyltransferase family protein [Baekduia sp.]
MPSIAELRAVVQPPSVIERTSGEHWSGPLYMRRISPYLTRVLLRTPLSATAVTWLMIPVGLLGALALTLPGVWWAVVAVLLIQLVQLLDCCDGEIARWRQTFSPAGVYLDRIAHHTATAALPAALGVRADGGWDSLGGWTTVGLGVSVLALLIMAETSLVIVARAEAGLPLLPDTVAVAAPRGGVLRQARRALRFLPFFRVLVPIEATFLALAAAIVDAATDSLDGSRVLLLFLVAAAAITAVGHLVGIMASQRLR